VLCERGAVDQGQEQRPQKACQGRRRGDRRQKAACGRAGRGGSGPLHRSGAPGGVGDAGLLVGGAGEREEQVGEAVEIAHDLGADAGGVGVGEGDGVALGAATDGAGEVQRGGGGGPAGQDEGVQGREGGLQADDLGLERGGARGVHARLPRRGRGARGQGQLGAEVEEVALEVIQGRVKLLRGPQGAGEAECARQLVEGAVGVDTDIVLGGVAARAQVGLARVAGVVCGVTAVIRSFLPPR